METETKKKRQSRTANQRSNRALLAGGTRGNPRQVKRFLNTLLLRKASATARGFEEDAVAG